MKIGSIKENLEIEQRIAVTPDIIKKYKSLNLNIILPKGYGEHLNISDEEFKKEGAEILEGDEKVLSEADAILQMSLISDNNFEKLKNGQFLIGVLNLAFEQVLPIGVIVAASSNFIINNLLTFRKKRLEGKRFFFGMFKFLLVSSLPIIANIGIATLFHSQLSVNTFISQIAGILVVFIWNYAASSKVVWNN